MYDNYNYPVGTDTPNAPWNQEETPIKIFDVFCSQTLSKEVEVKINDYIQEDEIDEDGHYQGYFVDTTDTDWKNAYGMEHYTPKGLIQCFRNVLKEMVRREDYSYSPKSEINALLKECTGWSEDETVIDGSV